MALDASEQEMVLLTPDEINRFISTLKVRYGGSGSISSSKKRGGGRGTTTAIRGGGRSARMSATTTATMVRA